MPREEPRTAELSKCHRPQPVTATAVGDRATRSRIACRDCVVQSMPGPAGHSTILRGAGVRSPPPRRSRGGMRGANIAPTSGKAPSAAQPSDASSDTPKQVPKAMDVVEAGAAQLAEPPREQRMLMTTGMQSFPPERPLAHIAVNAQPGIEMRNGLEGYDASATRDGDAAPSGQH